MRKIRNYQDFINEEMNLKKALIGGAIVASTLAGCTDQDSTNLDSSTYSQNQTITNTTSSIDTIPNSFEMDENVLTIGTDMTISSEDGNHGKVEERTLTWGKTFEYFDKDGNKKAIGKEKVLSLVTTIEIFDEKNNKIGVVQEDVIKGMFSFKSYYTIFDATGKVLGESAKSDWLTTNIEITSPNGNSLCTIDRPAINIVSDTWKINVTGDIDKRLIVFIPCYKTSADNERQ